MLPSVAGQLQRASTASFVHIAFRQIYRRHALRAPIRRLATVADESNPGKRDSLARELLCKPCYHRWP